MAKKQYLGDYTEAELNKMSPAYAARIRSNIARYGPDYPITLARGHKPRETVRAKALRREPEYRYTPEYLKTLSKSRQRAIEKELERSRKTGQPFDSVRLQGPKAVTRNLYYNWLVNTSMVRGDLSNLSREKLIQKISSEKLPVNKNGQTSNETYGEAFEKLYDKARKDPQSLQMVQSHLYSQYEKAIGYKRGTGRPTRLVTPTPPITFREPPPPSTNLEGKASFTQNGALDLNGNRISKPGFSPSSSGRSGSSVSGNGSEGSYLPPPAQSQTNDDDEDEDEEEIDPYGPDNGDDSSDYIRHDYDNDEGDYEDEDEDEEEDEEINEMSIWELIGEMMADSYDFLGYYH